MSLLLELDHLEIDDSSDSDDETTTSSDSSYDSEDDPTCGIIRFEVGNVSALDGDGQFSPEIEVNGVLWRLKVVRRKDIYGDEFLASYLYVQYNKSRLWSISVNASFILINADHSKNVSKRFKTTYKYGNFNWGYGHMIAWNDVIDEEKGFINDNNITVKVEFYTYEFEGYRTIREVSFTDRYEFLHDMVLVMDGKKIRVSKQILAIHSPVFNAMFYGNFDEKDKNEIELKDVDRADFIEMLNLIYPSYKKITDDNSEYILSMADRFQIQSVIDQVEQFFIKSSSMPVHSKLKLSNTYRLVKLQEHCLKWFSSERNKRLMNQEDIDSFIAESITKPVMTSQFDFTDAADPRHDITIVLNGGEKIYAGRKYLSLHSTEFRYEHFEYESEDVKEIKLNDVDREEFIEMLRVVYPTGQKITDINVKCLAKLGERFEIKYLLDLIESHLISSSNLGLGAKLLLSDQYKLIKLQVHCFNAPKNLNAMERIKKSVGYKNLSDATKVALLEEIFRFPR